MADLIRSIGTSSSGVNPYLTPGQKNNTNEANVQPDEAKKDYSETQVDPNLVMEFLANNNFFIAPKQDVAQAGSVDSATEERIAGYMEQFEMIYGIVVEEFGEELADKVMDLVMNRLMGMTE